MKKPLVSIIIPCYNAEKFIEACVNSVIAQDYENWECLLINDGSRDGTLNLIQSFESKENQIRVFTHENLGVAATRNRGIDHAKGDFLFFLDQDDILSNSAIGAFVSSYENNDIITGVTVTTTFVDGVINKISQLLHPKEGTITFENSHFEVLIRTMESGLKPVAQNRLYRKDFIKENQLYFKNGNLHEDELWFFEMMLVAKNVKFIDQETYYYRIDNQESITKNMGAKNLESYLEIMEEIIKKYSHQKRFRTIALWYAVYMKKIFLDYAIRDRSKLNNEVIVKLEAALKKSYIPLGKDHILSKNNDLYYRTINKLSLQNFNSIEKYFFKNPVNSLRKIKNVLIISYLLK